MDEFFRSANGRQFLANVAEIGLSLGKISETLVTLDKSLNNAINSANLGVKFTVADEFYAELEKEKRIISKDNIERGIVRVSVEERPFGYDSTNRNIFVVASCTINGQTCTYEKLCGSVKMESESISEIENNPDMIKTRADAAQVKKAVEDSLKALGITDIRGGRI